MATFNFNCPQCNNLLSGEDEWRGMETQCPYCKKIFVIQQKKMGKYMSCTTLQTGVDNPNKQKTFDFKCPICREVLEVQERFAGTDVQCLICGNNIAIPEKEKLIENECRRRKKMFCIWGAIWGGIILLSAICILPFLYKAIKIESKWQNIKTKVHNEMVQEQNENIARLENRKKTANIKLIKGIKISNRYIVEQAISDGAYWGEAIDPESGKTAKEIWESMTERPKDLIDIIEKHRFDLALKLAESPRVAEAELWLKRGADPYFKSEVISSILFWVKKASVARLLVTRYNLPVNITHNGTWLSEVSNAEVTQELLKHGMNINNGLPLHYAVSVSKDVLKAKLLLDMGYNINTQDKDGCTPLRLLVGEYGVHLDLLDLLLNYRANPMIKDNSGKNAIDVCEDAVIRQNLIDSI